MNDPLLFTLILGGAAVLIAGRFAWRLLRWYQLKKGPFPENWMSIVTKTIPFYENLPENLQTELCDHIKAFLFFKRFVGCAGLLVTEEMRVTIAACACLLLLNRKTLKYKKIRWIYLYPSEFVVRHSVKDAAGVVSTKKGVLAGEAWNNGRIILSWDSTQRGVYDFNDGANVVLHEFAHQLDAESGSMNGAPLLRSRGAYGSWATVLSRDFSDLKEHAYFGRKTVLDTYGTTNPAEFFAVATESFFEEPESLASEYSELFEELKKYYQVDPREWRKKPQKSAKVKTSKTRNKK